MLDALLVGGLAQAPVFITGDFDHQVIYRRHEDYGEATDAPPTPRATILRRVPGLMQLRLTSNVRTTPEVARFVAELIGEPTLYSEHRRSDDDQVSVERHTFTTTDEQQRLLADSVERILSEPFTMRELAILSPHARERSAAGQALADPTADAHLTSASARVSKTRRAFGGEHPRVRGPQGTRGHSDRRRPVEGLPPRSALSGGVAGDGSACFVGAVRGAQIRLYVRWQSLLFPRLL